MFRMLLVDDFEIDRENIKECIDWKAIDIEICNEARNGSEALELIKKNNYDLILTDVQMPFVDGIELASKAIQLNTQIKVVFMSYYNDFEYLKSAIDLNANGYILKPFIKEEVQEVFEKLIIKMKEQIRVKKLIKESRPLLINNFYKNIFNNLLTDEIEIKRRAKYLKQPLCKGYFQILVINRYEDIEKDVEDNYISYIQFNIEIEKFCRNYDIFITGYSDENYHFVILNRKNKEELNQLNIDFIDAFSRFLKEQINLYAVGISSIKEGIVNIARLYDEAMHAIKYSFYYGKCKILHYEHIGDINMTSIPINLNKLQEEIKILITSGDSGGIKKFINSTFNGIIMTKDNNYFLSRIHSILICLQIVISDFDLEFQGSINMNSWWDITSPDFNTIEQITTSLEDIIITCSDSYKDYQTRKKNKLIVDIKKYVEKNYMLDITVKDLSDEFFYSPNYLNGLFKKKVGKSIPDYITEIRINTARELLVKSSMKIYEIVEVVGYKRASHFNSIFKRYVGVTPKEYRGKDNG